MRALQRQLNAREFAEYMALDRLTGWTSHQRNKKRAIGLAMYHNAHADKKLKTADYEGYFRDPPEEPEAQGGFTEMMISAFKARGLEVIDKRTK